MHLSIYYWEVTWSPTPCHLPFAIIGRLVWNPRPGRVGRNMCVKEMKTIRTDTEDGDKKQHVNLIFNYIDSQTSRFMDYQMVWAYDDCDWREQCWCNLGNTHLRCSWHWASEDLGFWLLTVLPQVHWPCKAGSDSTGAFHRGSNYFCLQCRNSTNKGEWMMRGSQAWTSTGFQGGAGLGMCCAVC